MGYAIIAPLTKDIDAVQRFHRFRYHIGRGFVEMGDKVLDICCGTGYGTDILREAEPSWITGVDMEKDNITAAIESYYQKGIQFVCADVEKWELPEVDVATCFEGLEHLYQPSEFIKRLKTGVKKYIVFSVPVGQELVWDEERKEMHEKGDHTHKSVFKDGQEILNMFLDENWKLFYDLQIGVTYLAVVYNEKGLWP